MNRSKSAKLEAGAFELPLDSLRGIHPRFAGILCTLLFLVDERAADEIHSIDMQTILAAAALFDGTQLIPEPLIAIEDGRIAAISVRSAASVPAGAQVVDLPGATLAPAFLDVHIHGAAGHDVMEATPEALEAMGRFLASRGTVSYLATTVTAPLDATLRALEKLAKVIPRTAEDGWRSGSARPLAGLARPLGIHLEGPFLSHTKRGVHPPEYLLEPHIGAFDRMFEAAEGQVRLMTLAPELKGAAELAAHAVQRGVRVSVGHSNATAAETRAAVAAGATSATHTFNAMRTLDHREPGILGEVLTDDAIFAELICDGIHSAPEMTRLWWRAKGPERGILVTDAMSAAGMPDGEYRLGGFAVQVAEGRATRDGVLAGSVLTLDRALANCVKFTGVAVDKALRAVTANPAAMVGLEDAAGRVAAGRPANLVVLSAEAKLIATFVNGVRVAA
jgi:N-acetylglucosamine-6-phosphate deacetylase